MHWQTLEAVGKQLQAMGCAEYEIAAHDFKAGKLDAIDCCVNNAMV